MVAALTASVLAPGIRFAGGFFFLSGCRQRHCQSAEYHHGQWH